MKGTHRQRKESRFLFPCVTLFHPCLLLFISLFSRMDVNVLFASNDLGGGGGGNAVLLIKEVEHAQTVPRDEGAEPLLPLPQTWRW